MIETEITEQEDITTRIQHLQKYHKKRHRLSPIFVLYSI